VPRSQEKSGFEGNLACQLRINVDDLILFNPANHYGMNASEAIREA